MMKKDIFYGKIKQEYISYILLSIILITTVCVAVGVLCLYAVLVEATVNPLPERIFLGAIGAVCFLLGIAYAFITLFTIKKYPKYEKLRRIVLNSDCYFVDSNSKKYYGRRKDKFKFDLVTLAAEQNKGLKNIKYPLQYKIYVALMSIAVVMLFVNIAVLAYFAENEAILPAVLQDDTTLCMVFLVLEVVGSILAFIFAFRIKKIRIETICEQIERNAENHTTEN